MKRPKNSNAGIVNEHVNPTEGFNRLLDQPKNLLVVLDIGSRYLALDSGGTAGNGGFVKTIQTPGGQHKVSAFMGEGARGSHPNTARSSGDQNDLPGKPLMMV